MSFVKKVYYFVSKLGSYLKVFAGFIADYVVRKRRLYSNPILYLIVIISFFLGYVSCLKYKSSAQSKIANQQTPAISADFYSGWEKYQDPMGYNFRYPKDWEFKKEDDFQRSVCKDSYCLFMAFKKKNSSGDLKVFQRYEKEKPLDSGYIKIGETKVKKQKYLINEKSKEYYYPKAPQEVSGYQFMASLAYREKKLKESDVDMETLDLKAIAEKIISSIELN